MSAIKPFLEENERDALAEGEVDSALLSGRDRVLRANGAMLGAVAKKHENLSVSHAGLVRQLYTRQAVAEWLEKQTITAGRKANGEFVLQLSEEMPGDLVGWATTNNLTNVKIWGEDNSKMACPSFDLPAGAPQVGGACPGAIQGQSTISGVVQGGGLSIHPMPTDGVRGEALEALLELNALSEEEYERFDEERGVMKRKTGTRLGYVGTAICQSCYATGGNYLYTNKIVGEMVRMAWCKAATGGSRQNVEDWIDVMVRSLSTLCYDGNARRKYGISPVRIHSAGDFFDQKYAAAWIEVMNRVGDSNDPYYDPTLRFWAPTRTWAAWPKDAWPRLLSKLKQDNFSLRASAYHVGDVAPGGFVPRGENGYATGTTVTLQHEIEESLGINFDFNCPTYTSGAENTTCGTALGPAGLDGKEGSEGCRACWQKRDLRINYTLHL